MTKIFYGGFVNGYIHVYPEEWTKGKRVYKHLRCAVFCSLAAAKREYQDVRLLNIMQMPLPKKSRK